MGKIALGRVGRSGILEYLQDVGYADSQQVTFFTTCTFIFYGIQNHQTKQAISGIIIRYI